MQPADGRTPMPPDDAALIAETVAVFEEEVWAPFDPATPYEDSGLWHKELVQRIGPERTARVWEAAMTARWGSPEERRHRLDEALGR